MADAPSQTDLLVQYLQGAYAQCPNCKYELHQITQPRCPECGQELSLTVGAAPPKTGYWLAAIIIMSINAGVGVISAIGLYGSIVQRNEDLPEARFYRFMWWYLACLPLTAGLLLMRPAILGWGRGTQAVLLGLVVALTIGGFVWMGISG